MNINNSDVASSCHNYNNLSEIGVKNRKVRYEDSPHLDKRKNNSDFNS